MSTSNTKQAAWVAIGSIFSYSFALISSMILSRFLSKSDYGTYQQVLYVYNTLLAVFTLGLPRAYSFFLPRVNNDEAKDVINKINLLFFVLGGVFSFFLYAFSPVIADLLNNPELKEALRLFSPVPFFMLPTMGLEGVLATYRKTRLLAIYTAITRFLMLAFVAVPVVLSNAEYKKAIIGFTLSSFCAFCFALYLKYAPVNKYEKHTSNITYRRILNFALPLLYASIWGIVLHSANQFFVSRYFGSETFAEFSNGAIEVPFVGMIIGACSAVLSPIYSKLKNESPNFSVEVLPLWRSVFSKTVKLTYPFLLYCGFFAEQLMAVLYGEKYICSAVYFRILLVLSFLHVIAYGPFVINIGKVKYYANAHCITAIVVIIMDILCICFFKSPIIIMAISVICRIGLVFSMLHLIKNILNVRLLDLFPILDISKIIVLSIPILILLKYTCVHVGHYSALVVLISSFAVYCIFFLLLSIPFKIDYISIVKTIIKK